MRMPLVSTVRCVASAIPTSLPEEQLPRGLYGTDPLHQIGFPQNTSRSEQMSHLDNQSIDRGIFCCEPQKGVIESKHAVQIVGPVPFGLRQGEIRDSCRGPRRLDQLR